MTRFLVAAMALAGASLACCELMADHGSAPIRLVAIAGAR